MPPRPIQERVMTARELVIFWTSRAARAERDGDVSDAERCRAAAERWKKEVRGK